MSLELCIASTGLVSDFGFPPSLLILAVKTSSLIRLQHSGLRESFFRSSLLQLLITLGSQLRVRKSDWSNRLANSPRTSRRLRSRHYRLPLLHA